MIRPWAQRLGVGCIAFVFMAMGGARGMDAHSLSHGSHLGHTIAVEASSVPDHGAGDHSQHHAGPADTSESEEESSTECTCVGPCQGGSAPNTTRAPSYRVVAVEVEHAPVVAKATRLFYRDPTSHLLPFPNAPPARV